MTAVILSTTAAVAVFGMLALAVWLEHNVLSPRAMITAAVRSKVSPDLAEHLVAIEAETLLSQAEVERAG